MTLLSVGPNTHGLPDVKAVEIYTRFTIGSKQGNKLFRTDKQGTMKLTLKREGGWSLSSHQ